MENIHLSIIVPWRWKSERVELLRNMLNCLSVQEIPANFEPLNFKLIIVESIHNNVGGYEVTKNIVPEKLKGFTHIEVRNPSNKFNKSWCMNVGARSVAEDGYLVFMDADSLFGNDYIRAIKHGIRSTPPTHNKIMFCWNYLITLVGKDNPIARHVRPDTTCAMGGIWCCEKKFYFEKFGGMNENFEGYGGEDNEAYERALCLLGFPPLYMAYPLAHQYHDWEKVVDCAIPLFEKSRGKPKLVCERLINAKIGSLDKPTFIRMDDL